MRIIFCVIVYLLGVILMMGADIQKTSTLAKKKGNSITIQGLFQLDFLQELEIQTI